MTDFNVVVNVVINVVVSHQLTQEEALGRVKNFLVNLKEEFADYISHLHEEWNDETAEFSFTTMNLPVSGTLTVNPNEVEFFSKLPPAAFFLREEIKYAIQKRAETLLS